MPAALKIRNIVFHIILPLVAGVLIYILFREPVTRLHHWLGIDKRIFPLTNVTFLLYHFPDACWAYSLTASLLLFTTINKNWVATLSLLFLSAIEYQQASGSFQLLDWPDIIIMTIAVLLAMTLIKNK